MMNVDYSNNNNSNNNHNNHKPSSSTQNMTSNNIPKIDTSNNTTFGMMEMLPDILDFNIFNNMPNHNTNSTHIEQIHQKNLTTINENVQTPIMQTAPIDIVSNHINGNHIPNPDWGTMDLTDLLMTPNTNLDDDDNNNSSNLSNNNIHSNSFTSHQQSLPNRHDFENLINSVPNNFLNNNHSQTNIRNPSNTTTSTTTTITTTLNHNNNNTSVNNINNLNYNLNNNNFLDVSNSLPSRQISDNQMLEFIRHYRSNNQNNNSNSNSPAHFNNNTNNNNANNNNNNKYNSISYNSRATYEEDISLSLDSLPTGTGMMNYNTTTTTNHHNNIYSNGNNNSFSNNNINNITNNSNSNNSNSNNNNSYGNFNNYSSSFSNSYNNSISTPNSIRKNTIIKQISSSSLSGGFKKASLTTSIDLNRKQQIVCGNCKTTKTPLWRRDNDGNTLCNACGLFQKLHGISRPLSMKTDVIKRRNAKKRSKKNSISIPKSDYTINENTNNEDPNNQNSITPTGNSSTSTLSTPIEDDSNKVVKSANSSSTSSSQMSTMIPSSTSPSSASKSNSNHFVDLMPKPSSQLALQPTVSTQSVSTTFTPHNSSNLTQSLNNSTSLPNKKISTTTIKKSRKNSNSSSNSVRGMIPILPKPSANSSQAPFVLNLPKSRSTSVINTTTSNNISTSIPYNNTNNMMINNGSYQNKSMLSTSASADQGISIPRQRVSRNSSSSSNGSNSFQNSQWAKIHENDSVSSTTTTSGDWKQNIYSSKTDLDMLNGINEHQAFDISSQSESQVSASTMTPNIGSENNSRTSLLSQQLQKSNNNNNNNTNNNNNNNNHNNNNNNNNNNNIDNNNNGNNSNNNKISSNTTNFDAKSNATLSQSQQSLDENLLQSNPDLLLLNLNNPSVNIKKSAASFAGSPRHSYTGIIQQQRGYVGSREPGPNSITRQNSFTMQLQQENSLPKRNNVFRTSSFTNTNSFLTKGIMNNNNSVTSNINSQVENSNTNNNSFVTDFVNSPVAFSSSNNIFNSASNDTPNFGNPSNSNNIGNNNNNINNTNDNEISTGLEWLKYEI